MSSSAGPNEERDRGTRHSGRAGELDPQQYTLAPEAIREERGEGSCERGRNHAHDPDDPDAGRTTNVVREDRERDDENPTRRRLDAIVGFYRFSPAPPLQVPRRRRQRRRRRRRPACPPRPRPRLRRPRAALGGARRAPRRSPRSPSSSSSLVDPSMSVKRTVTVPVGSSGTCSSSPETSDAAKPERAEWEPLRIEPGESARLRWAAGRRRPMVSLKERGQMLIVLPRRVHLEDGRKPCGIARAGGRGHAAAAAGGRGFA